MVNFIAISGKIEDDNLEVYTKTGKRYNIFRITFGKNKLTTLKGICDESIKIPTNREIVIFGKIINLYGNLYILILEYKELTKTY